ncbi:serine/threonine-protein kinase mos-like [Mytilus trossulus]|uniref:serine/threonine-protein kinase mos-like n=1 Tax=Mytilus trossulus TaxID=6551 RepID=UPI00300652D8
MQIKSKQNLCSVVKDKKYSSSSLKGLNQCQHILRKYKLFRKKLGQFAKRIVMPVLVHKEKKRDEFKRPHAIVSSRHRNTSLKKEEVVLGRLLGTGGFGSVYRGKYKDSTVAVKVMHRVTKNPAAQLESFKAELNTIGFDHENIVKTITATSLDAFDQGAWIVMEYAGHRTLQSLIDDDSVSLGPCRRVKFSQQIAEALKYAHDMKIVHLDLKPANILITPDGRCKVADFGCSQKVEIDTGIVSPTQRSILTGTFAYRAPELLKGEAPSKRADIYALAVIMWQLLSRQTPFSNENQHVVIFGVVAYGQRPKHPEIDVDPFEESYRDLYSQCWLPCALDRPTAGEIAELLNIWRGYM